MKNNYNENGSVIQMECKLIHGDCITEMQKLIDDGVRVDMILTDPPYLNETVLDCFMGSGSTGVACLQTNRNFIGIELEEKYYEIAKERCKTYQTKLW